MRSCISVYVLVVGVLACHRGWAGHIDPELAEATAALESIKKSSSTRAEEFLAQVAFSHSRDPRPWIYLAEFRQKQGAVREAELTYRRAAEHASEHTRESISNALAAAGRPRLPDRGLVTEFRVFRDRAGADACARLRSRSPGPASRCPSLGLAFKPTVGGFACPRHALVAEDPAPYLIDSKILGAALRSPDAWLRVEALYHADQALLDDRTYEKLAAEADSAVRQAVLDRTLGGLPDMDLGKAARRAARAYLFDSSSSVRRDSAFLLWTLGETPRVSLDDLREMIVVADKGQGSKFLARQIFIAQRDEALPLVRRMLREPTMDGKTGAIYLLATAAGKEGLLSLARALRSPSPGLAERLPLLLQLLRSATGKSFGRDADAWIQELSR